MTKAGFNDTLHVDDDLQQVSLQLVEGDVPVEHFHRRTRRGTCL